MNQHKTVSVILTAFEPETLAYCLRSIAKQRNFVKEIILVEDWVYEKTHT